jgi:hypothetical protein
MSFDPVHKDGNPRVDPGVFGFSTSDPERYNSDLDPLFVGVLKKVDFFTVMHGFM